MGRAARPMSPGRPHRWMATQALRRWTESRLQTDSPSPSPHHLADSRRSPASRGPGGEHQRAPGPPFRRGRASSGRLDPPMVAVREPETPSALDLSWWRGPDLNRRPSGYERRGTCRGSQPVSCSCSTRAFASISGPNDTAWAGADGLPLCRPDYKSLGDAIHGRTRPPSVQSSAIDEHPRSRSAQRAVRLRRAIERTCESRWVAASYAESEHVPGLRPLARVGAICTFAQVRRRIRIVDRLLSSALVGVGRSVLR